MLKLRRILYPTDFSDCARVALPHALELARRHGARLEMLYVAPVFGDDPVRGAFQATVDEDEFYRSLRDESDARMQDMLDAFDVSGVDVRRVHTRGSAASDVIVDYTESEDVDTVVLGTHGRRGVRRMLLGSVTQHVVRHVGCPVLTVRKLDGPAEYGLPVQRILAPVDFSVHSINAVAYAQALGAAYEASVDLVHVIDPVLNEQLQQTGFKDRAATEDHIVDRARRRLQWLSREVRGPEGLIYDYHVVIGYPPEQINALAAERNIDLIVIASHGMTGLRRFPMGSVTERVMTTADCPVFVTKPFGKSLLTKAEAKVLPEELAS
jgi:nucleotide-binding universal stress UspA family protein